MNKQFTVNRSMNGAQRQDIKSSWKRYNEEANMTWNNPTITEICLGMEVATYAAAEI